MPTVSPAAAQAAPQQSVQSWQGWSFQTPAGWQTEETPAGLVIHPSSTDPLNRVLLLPAAAANGSLGQWFGQDVRQQSAQLRSFRPGPVKEGQTARGVPALTVTGQGITQQGQRVAVSYMGLLTSSGQGLLFEAQFDTLGVFRNLTAFSQFVKSVEPATTAMAAGPHAGTPRSSAAAAEIAPAASGTAAAPAAPNGHDLYDWFGAFRQSIMPGPNFTISTTMVWTFYRFFPNGYVYEGMPAGTDPALIECPAMVKGGKCKRYSITGSTLTIEGEKPHTLAREGSGIKIDGAINNRVRRADAPLSGTWKTSAGGGVLTTVTLSQHTLTLRPDGSFSITGGTGVSGANTTVYGSNAYSGHYKISGYTIEMDYSDGRVVRQSFLLPYPDDKVFLIGNAMYFIPTK